MMKDEICQIKILEKYTDLETIVSVRIRKVMDMLYKYRDTITLRDEIGTYPT